MKTMLGLLTSAARAAIDTNASAPTSAATRRFCLRVVFICSLFQKLKTRLTQHYELARLLTTMKGDSPLSRKRCLKETSDYAELKNEKRAIPQCFEKSSRVLGIIKCYRKYPSS